MATAGTSVVGVDWRVPLDKERRRRLGPGTSVQGNLDPTLCLGSWDVAAAETREVLARASHGPGRGSIWVTAGSPETDPGILEQVAALVHAEGRASVECRVTLAHPGTRP